MAYNNFKPTVWSKQVLRELEKFLVLDKDCNHQFDGEIKEGGKVKILGVSRPAIKEYTKQKIGMPEELEGTSVFLDIDKAQYFNFGVDDIDKAQATKGMMESYRTEATQGLAEVYDSHIAKEALNAGKKTSTQKIDTEAAAKKEVDKALVWLRTNGVYTSRRTVIEVTPWYYDLLMNNVIELKTNNDEMIKDGVLGMYKGAYVKMSNNLYNDGTDDYMMVRTDKAIAAGKQINKVEAYRPHERFEDAIKGLIVYGSKTVRPKELYTIKAHE